MDLSRHKYCSSCVHKLPPACFLKDYEANTGSRVYSLCIACCEKAREKGRGRKRKASQAVQPVLPLLLPPIPQSLAVEAGATAVTTLPVRPDISADLPVEPNPSAHTAANVSTGFLPVHEWSYIQSFHTEIGLLQIESCSRCLQRWFKLKLTSRVCARCVY
jgi:hypothetical protein